MLPGRIYDVGFHACAPNRNSKTTTASWGFHSRSCGSAGGVHNRLRVQRRSTIGRRTVRTQVGAQVRGVFAALLPLTGPTKMLRVPARTSHLKSPYAMGLGASGAGNPAGPKLDELQVANQGQWLTREGSPVLRPVWQRTLIQSWSWSVLQRREARISGLSWTRS